MHFLRNSTLGVLAAIALLTDPSSRSASEQSFGAPLIQARLARSWKQQQQQQQQQQQHFRLQPTRTAVELASLHFTQDSIGETFSVGQADARGTVRDGLQLDRISDWKRRGVQLPAAKADENGSHRNLRKVPPRSGAKNGAFIVNPLLRVVSSTRDMISVLPVELKTLIGKQKTLPKHQPVSISGPFFSPLLKAAVPAPAVGAEFLIGEVHQNQVWLTDDPLFLKDAKQVLRSIRDGGAAGPAAALTSPQWAQAVAAKLVPKFNTLRVVREDVDFRTGKKLAADQQTLWSVDNRRLHCLKEVFVFDKLARGEDPHGQLIEVALFRLSDMLKVSNANDDNDHLARSFFGMKYKSAVHGLTWKSTEYCRELVANAATSHRYAEEVLLGHLDRVDAQYTYNGQSGRTSLALMGAEGRAMAGRTILVRETVVSELGERTKSRSRAIAAKFPLGGSAPGSIFRPRAQAPLRKRGASASAARAAGAAAPQRVPRAPGSGQHTPFASPPGQPAGGEWDADELADVKALLEDVVLSDWDSDGDDAGEVVMPKSDSFLNRNNDLEATPGKTRTASFPADNESPSKKRRPSPNKAAAAEVEVVLDWEDTDW